MKRWLAHRIAEAMDRACRWTHDLGGCGLLNRQWLFWYDDDRDEFRIEIPNLWHPVWVWASSYDAEPE